VLRALPAVQPAWRADEGDDVPGSVCFVAHLVLPLIHRTSDALVGGAEVQTFHLAEELQRRGWAVSFLACALTPGGPQQIDTPLGPVRVLYPYRARKTLRDKMSEKRRTFTAVRAVRADVLVQRAVWDADVVALAARTRHLPYVYALASDRDAVNLRPWTRRRVPLRLATAVVAQSEAQQAWVRRYGRDCSIIPSGFPVPEWQDDRRDLVLWVGTLRALKQPDRFLDLAAALPEHRFVLVGGPGENAALAQRIEARARSLANVQFEGFVPYRQMPDYFQRARLLINTSTYEGFPNTFVLAWLHGAVVVSLGVDPDGQLTEGGLGAVARDPDALCQTVADLLHDEERRRRIAMQAREHAVWRHDIRAVADAYESLFASLTAR
jgi:glycosyltransferase involved in cell wall biosynthesis